MNDPDALDTQEAIKAMENEMDPEDPTQDDEDEAEFSVSERKLLWGVIIVLGVFALLEGAVIVNWGARIRSMERGGPGGAPDGGALFAGGGGGGQGPGVSAGGGGMVAGQAAVRQVTEAFAKEHEIDAEVTKKIVALMGETEAELESIPQRQRSGEIDATEAGEVMELQWERRKTESRELLGEELAAELESVLSGGASGGAMGMAPPGAPPEGGVPPEGMEPGALPPDPANPAAAPPEIIAPGGEPPVPPSEAGAPPK